MSGLFGWFDDAINNPLADMAALGLLNEYQRGQLEELGGTAWTEAKKIGEQAYKDSKFVPYTMTTATGGRVGMDKNGNASMSLSGQEQQFYNQAFNNGRGLLNDAANMDIDAQTGSIYDRMRAAQSPQEQRDRLALEQRLAAQGRLGMMTDMYGGTPEQFALAKAQQEANNNAYLGAMQQARADQNQLYNLGSGMITNAYLPQAQLLNAGNQALQGSQLLNQANSNAANLRAQGYMTGLDANLQANLGSANLASNYINAIAGLLGNNYATDANRYATDANAEANRNSFVGGLFGDIAGWATDAGMDIWNSDFGLNARNKFDDWWNGF